MPSGRTIGAMYSGKSKRPRKNEAHLRNGTPPNGKRAKSNKSRKSAMVPFGARYRYQPIEPDGPLNTYLERQELEREFGGGAC